MSNGGSDTIRVQVRFLGLVLFVVDCGDQIQEGQRRGEVTVLLPDARWREDREGGVAMLDKTRPDSHAGYVSWHLRNQDPDRFRGDEQAFYQLDHTEIDISHVGGDVGIGGLQNMANFNIIAPGSGVPSHFRSPTDERSLPSPDGPLALLALSSGEITVGQRGGNWTFSCQLGGGGAYYAMTHQLLWEAELDGSVLEVNLIPRLDGAEPTSLSLRPAGNNDVIQLTVANLCSNEVLGWDSLRPFDDPVPVPDADFAWLYTLLEHRDGDLGGMLNGHRLPIPYPELPLGVGGIFYPCYGAVASPF